MQARHKKKAIIGIPLGLLCFAGGIFLAIRHLVRASPANLILLPLVLFVGGFCLYVWGCLALARAKGYSTAIVLTVMLGQFVSRGGLARASGPDKNKQSKGYG